MLGIRMSRYREEVVQCKHGEKATLTNLAPCSLLITVYREKDPKGGLDSEVVDKGAHLLGDEGC